MGSGGLHLNEGHWLCHASFFGPRSLHLLLYSEWYRSGRVRRTHGQARGAITSEGQVRCATSYRFVNSSTATTGSTETLRHAVRQAQDPPARSEARNHCFFPHIAATHALGECAMRDRQNAFLTFVVLAVLACTGYVGYIRAHPPDLTVLAARVSSNAKPFRAIVVFRPEDCDSRIDFMHTFTRPLWRDSFAVGALVVGGAGEAKVAAQALTARGLSMAVTTVGSDSHPGRFLGYTSTPYLLVMDQQDRLRMIIPGPSSTSDVRSFEHATKGLLDSTSLPR